MEMDFPQTRGRQFFENDLARLAEALERLAKEKEEEEKLSTYSIVVAGNELPDATINRFIAQRVKRLIDIKVTTYAFNGSIKKEYLILYIPKA